MAAGWIVAGRPTSRHQALARAAVFSCAAIVPDLDLLTAEHRGPSHSLTAAALAGAAAWAWCALLRGRTSRAAGQQPHAGDAVRLALAVAAAYATHTLLDWLGSDSSPPVGIMALWPITREHYASDSYVFMSIWRRYWLPGFWTHNLLAVARELAILGPIAWAAWWIAGRRLRS
jgi:hypothetical protein